MSNKPVAWTNKDELAKYRPIIAEKEYSIHFPIPLYTQQRPHNTVLVPCNKLAEMQAEIEALKVKNQALKIMNDGKNKIIEEYEHKYPDFFFMENDLMGKR